MYVEKHGVYPRASSGDVEWSPGDTWYRIDDGLRQGCRGLERGSSLFKLTQAHQERLRPRVTETDAGR
jgi:hypothetical protein